MPVMETIRRATDSTAMRIVFGAIVLVFVFWGVGATGPQSIPIATVNGTRITDTQFQRIMRQVDRSGSMDEADRKRISQQVIDDLIQSEALLQEADRLGIEVSDEEIARQVLQIDDFKDGKGKFSQELYEKGLKRFGMTQGGYESQLREFLTLEKLDRMAGGGVQVHDGLLERQFRIDQTRLDLSWVRIPDAALLNQVPIDDATLDAFVATNADQIRVRYDKDYDRLYNEPAKATLATILLRGVMDQGSVEDTELRSRMEAIRAEAVAGADFGELATRYSEDLTAVNGGAQGTMSEPQLDLAIANAVFATEAGGVTAIVETARGLQILQVQERIEATITPMEDVQRDIARTLIQEDQVSEVAAAYAEKVLSAWKDSGSPPAELLGEAGLVVETSLAVSPTRPQLSASSPALLGALSSVTAEGVLDAVYPTDDGRVVAAVTSFQEPDMDLFAIEKESLRSRVLAMERQSFIDHWKGDVVARSVVEQLWTP